MTYKYTNLVSEGAGVQVIADTGAQKLGDSGILANIKNVAGTFAGAITTTLVARATCCR